VSQILAITIRVMGSPQSGLIQINNQAKVRWHTSRAGIVALVEFAANGLP
jgi:hypothetical protein